MSMWEGESQGEGGIPVELANPRQAALSVVYNALVSYTLETSKHTAIR